MTGQARYELCGTAQSLLSSTQWQARVDELRSLLTAAGLSPEQVAEDLSDAFGGITFLDAAQSSWRHDGSSWWRWTNGSWQNALPPPQLILDRVELDVDPTDLGDDDPDTDSGSMAASEIAFEPTHLVPPAGLPAWDSANASLPAAATLDPLLDVELLGRSGDGWAHIRCANGWSCWVDGRELLPLS